MLKVCESPFVDLLGAGIASIDGGSAGQSVMSAAGAGALVGGVAGSPKSALLTGGGAFIGATIATMAGMPGSAVISAAGTGALIGWSRNKPSSDATDSGMRTPRSFEVIILLSLIAVYASWSVKRSEDTTNVSSAQTAGEDVLLELRLGETLDDSSASRHITRANGVVPCTDRFGVENGASTFSGRSYIAIDRPEKFDDLDAFTLSGWVRPTIRQEHLNIISKVTPHRDFNLQIDALGRPVTHIMNQVYEFCYAKNSVPLHEWSFVAATYDAGVWKIYIDGKLDWSEKVTRPAVGQSRLMTVGALFPGMEGFVGDLDDIRVHSRALTADEISELKSE